MGRILAIDVGTKTLGLALSDEGGTVGMPLTTLRRAGRRRDLARLEELVRERDVSEIVVGLPLEMDGSPGAMSAEADRLCAELEERLGLVVHRWDERLTTAEAERLLLAADVSRGRRRKVVDKLAASLILQGFLDRRQLRAGGGGPAS